MLQKFANRKSECIPPTKYSNQLAKERIQQIVKAYRLKLSGNHKPLSFAKFAGELEKCVLSLGIRVSYQSVKNWEDGVHRPDDAFVLHLLNCSKPGTWQHSFAKDLLAAQWPQLYEPASEIGKQVLQQIQQN